jgi:hypothetical protein
LAGWVQRARSRSLRGGLCVRGVDGGGGHAQGSGHDGPDGLPGGLVPASPGDGDGDQFAGPGDRDGDLLDQDAQEFLAVGLGGGRGGPDSRQVTGQGLDG